MLTIPNGRVGGLRLAVNRSLGVERLICLARCRGIGAGYVAHIRSSLGLVMDHVGFHCFNTSQHLRSSAWYVERQNHAGVRT